LAGLHRETVRAAKAIADDDRKMINSHRRERVVIRKKDEAIALRALQEGKIVAFDKSGSQIAAAEWALRGKVFGADSGFERSAILALWRPLEEVAIAVVAPPSPPLVQSTGLPGRPTKSNEMLEDECRRRFRAGERHDTVTAWARELPAWFAKEHPAAPRPQ
jgi:hypothetical protein